MAHLPVPDVPTVIYIGTGGPRGHNLPFQHELNDGILAVSEAKLPSGRMKYINSFHSFIMNSPDAIKDILETLGAKEKA